MILDRFPANQDIIETKGFQPIKINFDYLDEFKSLLLKMDYGSVSLSEVDHADLYTRGTEMLKNYNQAQGTIIDALGLELIERSAKLLHIDPETLKIDYFISRCTEGYNVPWHSDCQNDKSVFSIPLYFNIGEYNMESGMLEFGYTHLISDNPNAVLNRYPTRDGYGAIIWSMNQLYSHRAIEVMAGATRFMIRYELTRI